MKQALGDSPQPIAMRSRPTLVFAISLDPRP